MRKLKILMLALSLLVAAIGAMGSSSMATPSIEDARANKAVVFVDSGVAQGVGFAIARNSTSTFFFTASHVLNNTNSIVVRQPGNATPLQGVFITHDHNLDIALFRVDGLLLPVFCLGEGAPDSTDVDLTTFSQDIYQHQNRQLVQLHYKQHITAVRQHLYKRNFYFQGDVIEGYSGSPIYEPNTGLLVGLAVKYSPTATLERIGVDVAALQLFYHAAQTNHRDAGLPNLSFTQNGDHAFAQLGKASRNHIYYQINGVRLPPDPIASKFYNSLQRHIESLLKHRFGDASGEIIYGAVPSQNAICSARNTPGVVVITLLHSSRLYNKRFNFNATVSLLRCVDRYDDRGARTSVVTSSLPHSINLSVSESNLPGNFGKWITSTNGMIRQQVDDALSTLLGRKTTAFINFAYAGIPIADGAFRSGRNFCDEMSYSSTR